MRLASALDDLLTTTLAALPSAILRLVYCSKHRKPDGKYRHWGLVGEYGEVAAQNALADAHRQVFLETLRTPLLSLLADASNAGFTPTRLAELREQSDALVPEKLGGGSARHFKTVLDALESLAQSGHDANCPSA